MFIESLTNNLIMETSYFYSDNLNLGDIENVLSRFASEKKQSIYLLRTPKGDTENTTYQSVMILSPGYKNSSS